MALLVDYYIFPGKFCFINHHGILNKEENLKYAHVLVDMEMKYNPVGYPSFLVGDFNAWADHPSHQIWREHWSDAADVGAEHRGHKETPRNPRRISGSDIL